MTPLDTDKHNFREVARPRFVGFLSPGDLDDGALGRAVLATQKIREAAAGNPAEFWMRVPENNREIATAISDAWALGLLTMVEMINRETAQRTASLVRPALPN
jgi:hypothetical protein